MPMTYTRRAEYRESGWTEFCDTTRSLAERRVGLLKVIKADYERSLEAWKGARKRRPHGEWPAYIASWLFTHGDATGGDHREVMAALCAEFPPAGPRLWSGYYWGG
jgi:hypothetical protein